MKDGGSAAKELSLRGQVSCFHIHKHLPLGDTFFVKDGRNAAGKFALRDACKGSREEQTSSGQRWPVFSFGKILFGVIHMGFGGCTPFPKSV